MSDLREMIKAIQRHVGSTADGVFGPLTASLVLDALVPRKARASDSVVDARSLKVIESLDPKAHAAFTQFLMLAKATAATLGCDYVFISGQRTWEDQDALYAQGRHGNKGPIVTQARGGQSNHNFGIAVDAGVFRAGDYLDGSKLKASVELAAKVHKACSEHAKTCGLEWGGSWKSMKDLPHYEVATGLSLAAKRKIYKEKGSVL